MYSKNYVVLNINDNGTKRVTMIKKDWLSSMNDWKQFKVFIKDNWGPKLRS